MVLDLRRTYYTIAFLRSPRFASEPVNDSGALMDHIPLPHSPVRSQCRVRYVCTEDYDGGPLLFYPARQGRQEFLAEAYTTLKVHSVETNKVVDDLGQTSGEETAAFLQTWLFFGLLQRPSVSYMKSNTLFMAMLADKSFCQRRPSEIPLRSGFTKSKISKSRRGSTE